MEVTRISKHKIHLSQKEYTEATLNKFRDLTRSSNTPIKERASAQTTTTAAAEEIKLFQRVIGKLMYLACNTRPDIMYAVIHASSYTQNPSPSAWEVVRDTLGYLSRTTHYRLTFKGSNNTPLQLQQYTDASFTTGKDRRSISRRIMLLNSSLIT
jgi:hypothetical protein